MDKTEAKEINQVNIDNTSPDAVANTESVLNAQNKLLEEYRDHLIKIMEGNSDRFEKQLSYISAGSLGVSMAFIKDIVGSLIDTHNTGLLLAGWIAMGTTLIANLLSQAYANYCHAETIGEIEEKCYDSKIATKRRSKIQYVNYFSIGTLFVGIGLLLFIQKNI